GAPRRSRAVEPLAEDPSGVAVVPAARLLAPALPHDHEVAGGVGGDRREGLDVRGEGVHMELRTHALRRSEGLAGIAEAGLVRVGLAGFVARGAVVARVAAAVEARVLLTRVRDRRTVVVAVARSVPILIVWPGQIVGIEGQGTPRRCAEVAHL